MRHGFLLIDKPIGPTSHDAVLAVRRCLHESKVGHLGTLDPQASGLLVLGVGAKALKVIELFRGLKKEYEADVQFGVVSSTYDGEGVLTALTPKVGWEVPEQGVLQRVLQDHFMGKIEQIPPMASAVHIGGERAYRKLRQGRGVAPPARQVEIQECRVLVYTYPHLRLRVTCSAGTYIRSLAHDLGQLLKCGGYLAGLRRTRVGMWSLSAAVAPERAAWSQVIPLKDLLRSFPAVDLEENETEALRHGRSIPHVVQGRVVGWWGGLPVAVLVPLPGGEGSRPQKVLF